MRAVLHTPAATPISSKKAPPPEWVVLNAYHPWLKGLSPPRLATAASLVAAGLLCVSLLARRQAILSAAAYGLSWAMVLVCLIAAGLPILFQERWEGVAPVGSVNEWLSWIGLVTVALGAALELWARTGWSALAGSLAGAMVLLAAQSWTGSAAETGMLVPAFIMAGACAAFALAWAIAVLDLVRGLGANGQPGATSLVGWLCCGFLLLGAAILVNVFGVNRSLGPWWQLHGVLPLGLLALALVLLLAHRNDWLGNFGLRFWTVLGITLLTSCWAFAQRPSRITAWTAWVAVLSVSLAVHAAQRRFFGQATTWKRPAGNLIRKSYRKPVRETPNTW